LLAPVLDSVLCSTLGLCLTDKTMHRLTAKFLLLFALVGTFAPLALAVTAATPHACCLRMAAHRCHGSRPESDQRTIHDSSCCNHDWRRAVTTSQWASPQARTASAIAQNVEARIAESHLSSPPSAVFTSQSTRAPPSFSIA
jgi:hypothetical protein